MDWQLAIGVGLAIVFGLLQYAVKDMPPYIAWAGIIGGILLVIWGIMPNHDKFPVVPTVISIFFFVCLVASILWGIESYKGDSKPVTSGEQETIKSPSLQRPEVGLRFVYPQSPALIITNKSTVVASDINWIVVLWNMSHPERNDYLPIIENSPGVAYPLMTPKTFGWVNPNDESGPINIFENPKVSKLLKPGDKLLGMAAVNCTPCSKGSTYVLSIVWGKSGWFAKTNADGAPILPVNLLKETRLGYFKSLVDLAPEQSRISIESEKTPTTPHANLTLSIKCLFQDDKMLFVNDGANDLYLWGYKLGENKIMESTGTLIPKDHNLSFEIGSQKEWIQNNFRPNSSGFMPSEIYLTDVSQKKKFLGRFTMDTINLNGSIVLRVFTIVPVIENGW